MSFHVVTVIRMLPVLAAGMAILSAVAMAQQPQQQQQSPQSQAQPQPPREELGFLQSIGRWFEEQGRKVGSTFKDAGKNVENFGREAGVAAKTTVDGARDAAGAVVPRLPSGVADGHEKCNNAPNGAPDCIAAATALCKSKGFATGKSADMTTADVCSPQVYLQGRNSGAGCKTETFVSRALCQ